MPAGLYIGRHGGAKGHCRPTPLRIQVTEKQMSRSALLLLIIAAIVIGGAIYLANSATEVPTTRMEQDVTNAALAQ
jgi:hypothetical protein